MTSLLIETQEIVVKYLAESITDSGGQDDTWTKAGSFWGRLVSLGGSTTNEYQRHTYTKLWNVIAENVLPSAITIPERGAFASLALMFGSSITERMRLEVDGRTLSPEHCEVPNDGQLGVEIVKVRCIETPQPVGYMDRIDG